MKDHYFVLNPDGTTTAVDDVPRWPSHDERRIDKTTLDDGVCVSTVFLVINHAWGDGPPLLFETMVFEGEHDQYCDRYATIDEARAGHARVVAALRESRDPGEGQS